MRYVVYMVAVIAAAGIVYSLGTSGNGPVADQQPATAEAVAAAPVEAVAVETVSLNVPGMHCPMACYPSVKKTLEGESGVAGVDLVEQKEEGLIDNPVVVIKHTADFDLDKAVASLEKVGFAGASPTQQ